jgi:hypothetical protein
MAQYQVRTGPVTNDAATFEPAMVQGSKPDQPRLFSSRNQQGLTLAQTTHVPAPFVPSMSAGYGPEKNRERLPLRIGWSVSQTTHDAAPFSLEMSAGWVPDRNRERLPLRTGWSISQPTQTDAPFSIEMVKGWQPESARVFRVKLGWSWSEHTFDLVMSPDMFGGWHPDTSRAFLAPRLGQPLSQTAQHVAAPFTPEMVAGSGPDRARLFVKPRLGWQWAETTFDVQMTAEMFAGSHPDTSRAWLAPRIPLPLAQPSHVSAPFGHEMVAGQHPDLPRQPFKAKDGWQTAQLAFVVQMTPDQWAGWLPSAPRIFLGPKIPLPISQPTHVNAPFTPDMVAGKPSGRPAQAVCGAAGLDDQPTDVRRADDARDVRGLASRHAPSKARAADPVAARADDAHLGAVHARHGARLTARAASSGLRQADHRLDSGVDSGPVRHAESADRVLHRRESGPYVQRAHTGPVPNGHTPRHVRDRCARPIRAGR